MYVTLKKELAFKAFKVDSGTPFRDYATFFKDKLVSISWMSGIKRVATITYKYHNPINDVEEYANLEVPFDNFTIVENVDGKYFAIPDHTFHMLFEKVCDDDKS